MYKLHKGKSDKTYWWFTLCGKNGAVILTSEVYTRRQSAVRALMRLKKITGDTLPIHE